MMDVLGLLVLGLPYVLILLWLPFCIWLAARVSRKYIKAKLPIRIAGGTGIFLLAFILPFGDEIAGTIYFNHLCETEAGAKVYQTIELPAEYWDENGKPKFFNQYGFIDQKFWASHIDEAGKVIRISSFLGIDRDDTDVNDKGSGITLGKIVTFRNWGGWVSRNLSINNTAQSCRFLHEQGFSYSFYSKLYKPEGTSGRE